MYLLSPFTFALLTRWPRARRWCGPIGLILAVISFLASSFATAVWHLIVTQGVLSALGCGLLFTPATLYLDEWFVRRKGLAYGIMWGGKALTGVGVPFAMEASLARFGPAITLRAWSLLTVSSSQNSASISTSMTDSEQVVMSAPLIYYLRPRIPLPPTSAPRPISMAFLTLPSFWMLQIGNILQGLGYFLPYAYLSSYTVQQLHQSTTLGTLVLALGHATSIPGGIIIGALGDRIGVYTTVLISTVGSAIAVFLFWGLSSHVALLLIFAITYGFFAGGFSSTWSGVLTELKAQDASLDTGLLFGLLAGGRGIGNVISGPLSVALLTKDGWLRDGRSWGFSGQYGGIIFFTGATAVLGGWGALGRLWK
jgi:MFS family permease